MLGLVSENQDRESHKNLYILAKMNLNCNEMISSLSIIPPLEKKSHPPHRKNHNFLSRPTQEYQPVCKNKTCQISLSPMIQSYYN